MSTRRAKCALSAKVAKFLQLIQYRCVKLPRMVQRKQEKRLFRWTAFAIFARMRRQSGVLDPQNC